jgi:hypothetical protein
MVGEYFAYLPTWKEAEDIAHYKGNQGRANQESQAVYLASWQTGKPLRIEGVVT